jgi:hypothetical protein
MNARHGLYACLLMSVNAVAAACDLPALVAIPAERIGDESARLVVAVQRYIDGIKGYAACTQAELAAAGGDAAPASLRNQLIVRNNAAVAEAGAVLAAFGERLTPARNLYLAEFIAGDGEECVQTPRLDSTAVINDIAVLFIERHGGGYLNVLEESCPNLDRFGRFETHRHIVGGGDVSRLGPVRTNRLCSNEFIEPYAFETSAVPQRECPLGRFFGLTPEQVTRLMASRAASQAPVAPEPESVNAPREETPARPRSER